MSAEPFGGLPSPGRACRISSGRTFETSTGRVARRPNCRAGGSSTFGRGVAAAIARRVDSGIDAERDDEDTADVDSETDFPVRTFGSTAAADFALDFDATRAVDLAGAALEAAEAAFGDNLAAGFAIGVAPDFEFDFEPELELELESEFEADFAPAFATADGTGFATDPEAGLTLAAPASCDVTFPTLIVPRGSILGSREGVRAAATRSAALVASWVRDEPDTARELVPPTTDFRPSESDANEPETLRFPRADESLAIDQKG